MTWSVTFVINALLVIFGAIYWVLSLVFATDAVTVPVPDSAKAQVLTVRIVAFIYSFIVAAWSLRYVSAQAKTGLWVKLGTFAYSVAMGLVYYACLTLGPENETCRKFVVNIQPLLGSLAIVCSVSFGGVLQWLTDHKILKP